MSIINGYKVTQNEDGSGWYTFCPNLEEIENRVESGRIPENHGRVPCRYVKRNRWEIGVEVDESNLITSIYRCFTSYRTHIVVHDCYEWYTKQNESWGKWDLIIEAGKSYMVGSDVPTEKFLKTHSSGLSDWQKLAFEWAVQNKGKVMVITTGTVQRPFTWHVTCYDEYVDFSLPHHGEGGERNYVVQISRPTRKILVNVD